MKEKLDALEIKKSSLMVRLEDAKRQHEVHKPSEEMIRAYLLKDSDTKNMSLDEQKHVVQAYVKEVIIYNNTMEVNTIVTIDG